MYLFPSWTLKKQQKQMKLFYYWCYYYMYLKVSVRSSTRRKCQHLITSSQLSIAPTSHCWYLKKKMELSNIYLTRPTATIIFFYLVFKLVCFAVDNFIIHYIRKVIIITQLLWINSCLYIFISLLVFCFCCIRMITFKVLSTSQFLYLV